MLIEAYQNIKQGRANKKDALVELSQNLRQMAINEGLEIDDTFRNLNGMQWQLGLIERAFVEEDYENRTPSRIFVDMVAMYNENQAEFTTILVEAHSKIKGKKDLDGDDRKQLFVNWLKNNTNLSANDVVKNIEYVADYAIKHSITKENLWDISDYKELNVVRVKISGNKFFKFMHGKDHRQFEKNGKLYADFLKECNESRETSVKKEEIAEKQSQSKQYEHQSSNEGIFTLAETVATVSAEMKVPKANEQVLNLNNIPNLSFTKPTSATFMGIELDAYNWKLAYISVLNILYRVYSGTLNNYIGKSFGCGTRIDLSCNSSDLKSPKLISLEHSVYVESNLSAYDIAKRLATVLKICGVTYEKLVIKYKRKESGQNENGEVCQVISKTTEKPILHKEICVGTSIIDEYIKWLATEKGLSESTSKGYGSTLRIANLKAQEMGLLNGSLFESPDDKLKELIVHILSDSNFSQYNAEQHNRFSAAINAYLMFKTGESVSGIRVRKRNTSQEKIVCPNNLKTLLLKKFPYGIRVDSEIDIIKLKNFAEMFEVSLPDNDDLLKAQIAAGGISFEGKIYFVSDEVCNNIIQKIKAIFEKGFSVVYYEELLDKNFDWFDDKHISSWEFLREILDKKSDDIFIGKNFLRKSAKRINEADAVEIEMESVWGDDVIHTYDEMYERLPYIPDEKIKFYLSYCKKFVWSTHETFAWIDKIIVTEEEHQAIFGYVKAECELNGHASIVNVPLGNIEEENYQISLTALYDALYHLILKEEFALNGKILTKKDSVIDALTLARAYCSERVECSLAELNDYVVSINGTENRQITFRAAYDQMIRIDEYKFIADDRVNFEIDAIDSLLEQMIKSEFTSIKSIVTFIMFPNCGQTWTHYLLESFCYRFSKKFRLEVINFNDRNTGIIAQKGVNLSYVDMLAVAAIRSGLDLRTDIIGEYLYNNGYIARRRETILNYTVERAKQMKEGR